MKITNSKVKLAAIALIVCISSGLLYSKDSEGDKLAKTAKTVVQNLISKTKSLLSGNTPKQLNVAIPKGVPYVPGEILVKFTENAGISVQEYSVSAKGHRLVESLTSKGLSRVSIAEGKSVEDAIAEVKNQPNVEYAQPNYIYWATVTPNDTEYAGKLWGLKNTSQTLSPASYPTNNPGTSGKDMDMELAWDVNTNCNSTIVAVIDSGVNYNHQELSGNMWNGASCVSESGSALGSCISGYDYVDTDKNPMDLNGHGTHVAGTIAAAGNNNSGSTGICWTAKVMAVRVLNSAGSGTTANIVKGVNFALRNGAKVINMSLGGSSFDAAFNSAITTGGSTYDALFIVAAGNDGTDVQGSSTAVQQSYPCEYTASNLLCVAALDQAYDIASFSNFDANTTAASRSVDIGAPGTNIYSSWAGNEVTLTDDFNSSGVLDWTLVSTAGSAWGYVASCALGSPVNATISNILAMSSGATCSQLFGPALGIGNNTGGYANSTVATAYKSFNVSGYEGITLNVTGVLDIEYNTSTGTPFDKLFMHSRNSSGNPAANNGGSGTSLSLYGLTTGFAYFGVLPFNLPLNNCIGGSTCSVGFTFTSDSSETWGGIALIDFYLQLMDTDVTTAYNTIDGTSMATPHVAGLATLLRAYNPSFTYQDTIDAILNGGEAATSLATKTRYGLSVNANNSIRYLKAPTTVTAVIAP